MFTLNLLSNLMFWILYIAGLNEDLHSNYCLLVFLSSFVVVGWFYKNWKKVLYIKFALCYLQSFQRFGDRGALSLECMLFLFCFAIVVFPHPLVVPFALKVSHWAACLGAHIGYFITWFCWSISMFQKAGFGFLITVKTCTASLSQPFLIFLRKKE